MKMISERVLDYRILEVEPWQKWETGKRYSVELLIQTRFLFFSWQGWQLQGDSINLEGTFCQYKFTTYEEAKSYALKMLDYKGDTNGGR
jgi:hypothetical protein